LHELRLGFLSSHSGTNMQAIFDAVLAGRLKAELSVVISNNANSTTFERAKRYCIPWKHLSSKTHSNADDLDRAILTTLSEHDVNLVILAGYMKRLGPKTINHFKNKILNIHPALLPKFGGKGMHGKYVHEAVLASGDKVTGVTIHIVDEDYDRGPVVAQRKVSILEGDTATSLADRVLKIEHKLYSDTIQKISEGSIVMNRFSPR